MWLKSSSHYKVPAAIIVFSIVAIGFLGYTKAGDDGAEALVKMAAIQAGMQFPIGVAIIFVASRLLTFDFGTFGTISLKILSISLFEEAVTMGLALLANIPPGSLVSSCVSFVIFLFMVMILFETTGAETWIIAGVTLLASYALSHYLHPKAERQVQKARATHSATGKHSTRNPRRTGAR